MIAQAPGNFNHDNCFFCETGMRYQVSRRLILIRLSVLALLSMACSSIPFVGGGAEQSEGSDFATAFTNATRGDKGDADPEGPAGPEGPDGRRGELGPQGSLGLEGPLGRVKPWGGIGPAGPFGVGP